MQAGGGCGDAARLARVDGLVALAVRRRVRRAGCREAAGRGRGARALRPRSSPPGSAVPCAGRLGTWSGGARCSASASRSRPRSRRFGGRRARSALEARRRSSTTMPARRRRPGRSIASQSSAAAATDEQDLGLAAAARAAEEARGEDAAAVRDQEVAGSQELRQVGEAGGGRARLSRGRARAGARRRARPAAPGRSSSGGKVEVVGARAGSPDRVRPGAGAAATSARPAAQKSFLLELGGPPGPTKELFWGSRRRRARPRCS